jgi:hypothetical protein
MDVSASQPTRAAGREVDLGPPGIRRLPGRRRPSGQPPPLPHHLQTTGVGWLTAAVVLVALSVVVFGGDLRGPAVTVTVVEDAVVQWLAGLDAPGLLGAMRTLAALGSWTAINLLLWGLLAMLIRRRFRHLLVLLVAWILQGVMIQILLAPMLQRPRPFGVEFRTDWTAWVVRPGEFDRYRRRMVETGQRADGQFKVLRLTSDTSFAAEFAAERDLIGSQPTKA